MAQTAKLLGSGTGSGVAGAKLTPVTYWTGVLNGPAP
jgi:hypothetical protein